MLPAATRSAPVACPRMAAGFPFATGDGALWMSSQRARLMTLPKGGFGASS